MPLIKYVVSRLAIAAALIALIILGRVAYVEIFGYPASKIEADLCNGYRLREQETDGIVTLLQCSSTKVGNGLPFWIAHLAVDPNEKFTLAGMDEVCRRGTKPKDVNGKLACIPY